MIDVYLTYKQNEKTPERYDLEYSSEAYKPLQLPCNKRSDVYVYLRKSEGLKAIENRKAEMMLVNPEKHITGLFFPNEDMPQFCYGDIKDTRDLLLILINGKIEIFVCKGKLPFKNMILNNFFNGDLNDEIESLRAEHEEV